MIITLTPFPSIAYIYRVDELMPEATATSKNVSFNILSKGVYSAQIMKVLQEEPMVISCLGGFAGKGIKHYLDKSKVKSDIVWTHEEMPHYVRLFSEKDGHHYSIQPDMTKTSLPAKELPKLNYKLRQHIKKTKTLVLSGDLPLAAEEDYYKEWLQLSKQHNVKVIVSTGQSQCWQQLLEAKPYALMLTEKQLQELGYTVTNELDIINALMPHLGEGLHYIGVFLKNRGALLLSSQQCSFVQSTFQMLNVDNTAASGAFLGAMAIGISRKYEQEKIAKLCLAAALAADDNMMHPICSRKEIEYLYKKTKVRKIHTSLNEIKDKKERGKQ